MEACSKHRAVITSCDHEMTLGVGIVAASFCKNLSCGKWLPRQWLPWLLVKHFEHEAEGEQAEPLVPLPRLAFGVGPEKIMGPSLIFQSTGW